MRTGSATTGARALARQFGATRMVVALITGTAVAGASFVSLAPRLFERASDADLRQSIERSEPEQRNLELTQRSRIDPGAASESTAPIAQRGERFFDDFPPSIQSIVAEQHHVVESPSFRVSSFPDERDGPFPTSFTFRHQDDIEAQMEVVRGALPGPVDPIPMLRGRDCPDDVLAVDEFETSDEVDCDVVRTPVFDVVVSEATAEAMMLEVGDLAMLRPDGDDPVWFTATSFVLRQRLVLRIAGLVRFSDSSGQYWFADSSLHRPRITENPDFRLVFAAGVIDPTRYEQLLQSVPFVDFDYTWRYLVDADAIDSTRVAELASELGLIAPDDATLRTQLRRLLDEFVDQQALATALLSTVLAGMFVVALATLLVLAMLLAARQRDATVLVRDRGASRGQLVSTEVVRWVLLVVPATAVSWTVGSVLLDETRSTMSTRAALAFATIAVAGSVAAAFPTIVAPLGRLQRRTVVRPIARWRRLVLDGLVVSTAIASVVLLRRRGRLDRSEPAADGFDLLLAVAPAMLAVAAGVLLVRLFGPLLSLGAWLGGRVRGVSALIGFRRTRTQAAGRAPAMVSVVAVGVAVFGSVVQSSVDTGQEAHAWYEVGADLRVEATGIGARLPVLDLGEEVASGRPFAPGVRLRDVAVIGTDRAPRATALALDIAAYQAVLSHAPVEIGVLDRLRTTAADGFGADDEIPIVLAGRWPAGTAPAEGSLLELDLGRVTHPVTVAGSIDRFPSLPVDQLTLILPLDALQAVDPPTASAPSVLFIATDDVDDGFETALDAALPNAQVRWRTDALERLTDDEFGRWVRRGFAAVVGLATAFAIVAATAALALTAPGRRRDLGYLRTLGLRVRQATRITVLEHLPLLGLSVLAGTVLGIASARLLAPALDLDAFTGRLVPTELVVDLTEVAVLAGTFALALGAAVAIATVVHRRADEAELLRRGGD